MTVGTASGDRSAPRPERRGRCAGRLVLAWLALGAGCVTGDGSVDGGVPDASDGGSAHDVRVGTPDPETGRGFVPLEADGDIVLDTFGQGGSHAELALECTGFGNTVYPQFVVEDLATGETIMTAPFSRPQLLACDDAGRCVDSPNYVMLGGLADSDALDGLHVRVTAIVESRAGVRGEASQTGYLRRH